MKAIILAAGYGSRLGELTRNTPKPLMKAGGKPLIEHVIQKLVQDGFTEVVVNLHYHGEMLKSFLQELQIPELKIFFSEEPELLGTGGGIAKAFSFLGGGEFAVHNSDVYSNLNLSELIHAQRGRADVLATLAVRDRETQRYLLFDEQDCLIGWENQATGAGRTVREATEVRRYAFSGMYVISSDIQQFFPDEDEFSIITAFMNAAEEGKKIVAHKHDGYWIDVGTPEKLEELDGYLSTDEKS